MCMNNNIVVITQNAMRFMNSTLNKFSENVIIHYRTAILCFVYRSSISMTFTYPFCSTIYCFIYILVNFVYTAVYTVQLSYSPPYTVADKYWVFLLTMWTGWTAVLHSQHRQGSTPPWAPCCSLAASELALVVWLFAPQCLGNTGPLYWLQWR